LSIGESPMGSGLGSGAVQDDATGRKALKVGHYAVSRLPYGTLDGSILCGNVLDATTVAEGSSLPSRA
jgi:hypothetical protein